MNDVTQTEKMKLAATTNFANPQLAKIVELAEVRQRESIWKSISYEVGSWLVLPLGLIVFAICFALSKIFFETVFYEGTRSDIEFYKIISKPLYFLSVIVIGFICYIYTFKFFFKARRWAKRYRLNALSNLSKDARNPVLFLRSFGDDKTGKDDRRSLKTSEEDLVLALKSVGPVVAIGEPKEDISLLGATRVYMKNEGWQKNVESLMNISRLVVIQAGYSDGLLWELKSAIQNVEPTNLIISFLVWDEMTVEDRNYYYRLFKNKVEKTLNSSGIENRIVLPDAINDASFLFFNENWETELATPGKLKRLFYRFSPSRLVNETLRPALRRRNVRLPWRTTLVYSTYIFWLITGFIVTPLFYIQALVTTFTKSVDNVLPGSIAEPPIFFMIIIVGVWLMFYISFHIAFFMVFFFLLWKGFILPLRLLTKIFNLLPARGSGIQESIGLYDKNEKRSKISAEVAIICKRQPDKAEAKTVK